MSEQTKKIKITLNGKTVETSAGANLVDVAKENGVEIPHYCYHPGLPIAGQCRMCLVDQEGVPKLQIACNTRCIDGQKFVTNSDKVTSAVQSSLEMHLINHPIDCPICDQAGECGLQEYYMKHGKYHSEMHEEKVNKEKAVDLGDHIVLDKERCILCSRCVRFTADVSKTNDFGIFQRGDRSVIGTYNDAPLKGNYQLNTVDICPVGALTSKDFRFEQRVWFLDESQSICGGCSQGCNVNVHHKKGKHVYRLKPRYNAEVNQWWMCDKGRYTYKDSNYDKRLTNATLAGVELPHFEAMQNWATDLRVLLAMERVDEAGVFLSPQLTNEEIASALETLSENFGIKKFFAEDIEAFVKNDSFVDGLLYRSDLYPNSRGLLKAFQNRKLKLGSLADLTQLLGNGTLSHMIMILPEGSRILPIVNKISRVLKPQTFVVCLSPQKAATDAFAHALSIPTLSHYEKSGTMINQMGKIQNLGGDFRMFKEARSLQEIMADLSVAYRESRQERGRMAP